MASIKGIALKSVKSFTAREGIGFTSNLYMDNKKIGTAGDEGNGGEVDVWVLPEFREEFSRRVREYFTEKPASFETQYDFINELYALHENEKQFKKNQKKGFPILIAMAFHKRTDDIEEYFKNGYKPDIMVGVRDEAVAQKEIESNKPLEYTVFRTLEDFVQ